MSQVRASRCSSPGKAGAGVRHMTACWTPPQCRSPIGPGNPSPDVKRPRRSGAAFRLDAGAGYAAFAFAARFLPVAFGLAAFAPFLLADLLAFAFLAATWRSRP